MKQFLIICFVAFFVSCSKDEKQNFIPEGRYSGQVSGGYFQGVQQLDIQFANNNWMAEMDPTSSVTFRKGRYIVLDANQMVLKNFDVTHPSEENRFTYCEGVYRFGYKNDTLWLTQKDVVCGEIGFFLVKQH